MWKRKNMSQYVHFEKALKDMVDCITYYIPILNATNPESDELKNISKHALERLDDIYDVYNCNRSSNNSFYYYSMILFMYANAKILITNLEALPEEALPEEALPEEALPEEALPEEALPEEASNSLSKDENHIFVTGYFQGFLPNSKLFEFVRINNINNTIIDGVFQKYNEDDIKQIELGRLCTICLLPTSHDNEYCLIEINVLNPPHYIRNISQLPLPKRYAF